MTDFLKIAKSIVVHFAHICAYGVETVNVKYVITNIEVKSVTATRTSNYRIKVKEVCN